ncbi:hypothetical protein [Salinispora tropica]|uniref:Uncharacterized protein n=1 Tax=Salinispora tropica (strain ATCC BAA-916 / DSM 44818 / JCM 13857 / NBRC 105044 / CNB-440) TaxID=369723 RepID=A4XDE5_SALTO|nr:hypothetical protein [Salinispora tropica]ABP56952.1 hypothetical protein Strop_4524 [Salinispora tropica CNB-440]
MDPEQPIPRQEDRSNGITVGQSAGADPQPPGRRRVTRLLRDRRPPLVLAGLGATAGLASLVGEWVVLHLPTGGPAGGPIRIPETVDEVGSFGTAYLVGLLGLAVLVALALRGTGAARPNARIAGLVLAAALLTVLVAGAATIGDADVRAIYYRGQEGFDIEYGRGMVTAFLACALLGAALLLDPGSGPVPEAGGAAPARRLRSRRSATADDLPPPADLTVGPAAPFVRPD